MESPSCLHLCDLTQDILCCLMLYLDVRDICTAGQVCHRLRQAAFDEVRVWAQLCQQRWGKSTSIARWLPQAAGPSNLPPSQQQSYRLLYPTMLHHEELIGVWRGTDDQPRGSLFSFQWAADCVEVVQVVTEPLIRSWKAAGKVSCLPVLRLGPGYPCSSASLVDGMHCIVKHVKPTGRGSSGAAEAAAAVAAGVHTLSLDPGVLGSSPPKSFTHEIFKFMQGNVAHGRSSAKKAVRRSPGQVSMPGAVGSFGSSGAMPHLSHFIRVPMAKCTKQHPLAGLWKGTYGNTVGMQFLSISYDFRGTAARIVATKLTGDVHVPAGCETWVATASPIPQPLPDEELVLIQQRLWFLHDHAEAGVDGHAVQGQAPWQQQQPAGNAMADFLAGLFDDADPNPNAQDPVALGSRLTAPNSAEGALAAPEVVAVYKGQGRVGQHVGDLGWVEGRLWVYNNGNIAFLFLGVFERLVEFQRLSWKDN